MQCPACQLAVLDGQPWWPAEPSSLAKDCTTSKLRKIWTVLEPSGPVREAGVIFKVAEHPEIPRAGEVSLTGQD